MIFVPVYAGGVAPEEVDLRRQALKGFVYSPFHCEEFFSIITDSDRDTLMDYTVYDSPSRGVDHLLYSSAKGNPADSDEDPLLQPQTVSLEVAGHQWTIDFQARRAAGSWSGYTSAAVVFMSGSLTAFCLFLLTLSQARARAWADLNTEQLRRSQEALRDSESRLRRLVDSNLIGVIIADGSGRIVEANQAFLRIVGYSRQEMDEGAIDWKRLAPSGARGTGDGGGLAPHEPLELEYTRKDGSSVPVLVGLADLGGAESLQAGFILDLTVTKRDEQERAHLLASAQSARAEAEAANRSKDEFLAALSHELRTPLNAILGWAQLLRMGGLEADEVDLALETIERNAKVQAQLVEDLLDLSRIISGKLRLDLRPIELPPVIEAALDSVRPAAAARGIFVLPVLDAHASPVLGDVDRLQQVVWNLLSNAIKFTPPGGRVELFLQRTENQAEISVSDTGQGISADFLPYVFDRLRQADGSSTRRHGGLGLGLSIVRHLVELHGGWVRASSRGSGLGATFTVCLPLATRIAEVTPIATPANGAAGRSGALAGVRALVVDDEPDARELMVRVLQRAGAEVAAASSASEAFSMFREFRPTAVVSDISMPGEDGYFLMRQIRRLNAADGGSVPAVAVTAFAQRRSGLRR